MKKRWTRTRQTLSAGLLTLVVVFAQLALAPTAGAAPKLAKGTVLLFSHPGAYSWIGHLAVGVKVDQSQNRYCYGSIDGGTSSRGRAVDVDIPPGQPNGGWNTCGSFESMMRDMAHRGYQKAKGQNFPNPNVDAALNLLYRFDDKTGYRIYVNDCVSNAAAVAAAYGTPNLPNRYGWPRAVDYYAAIGITGVWYELDVTRYR